MSKSLLFLKEEKNGVNICFQKSRENRKICYIGYSNIYHVSRAKKHLLAPIGNKIVCQWGWVVEIFKLHFRYIEIIM